MKTPEAKLEANRRWRERNPEKAAAHNKARRDRKQPTPEKRREYGQRSYAKNAAPTRQRQRRNRAYFPDGLFEERLAAQGGVCAICRQAFKAFKDGRSSACADHCHVRLIPRGVLCYHCNTALGHYELHQRATISIVQYEEYLERF